MALLRTPRGRPLRHAHQRGRGRGVRVRRAADVRRRLRGEGIFRFNLNAAGEAGHASVPQLGDNALLKLAPALTVLANAPRSYTSHRGPHGAPVRTRARSRRHRRLARCDRRRRTGAAGVDRADVRGDADADDDLRVIQDERDPRPRAAADRLPDAAGARRGRGPPAHRRGARRRRRRTRGRVLRADDRQRLADPAPS